MATRHDSMVNPRIEELLGRAGNKFTLVTLGAPRARQSYAYFNKLGDGHAEIPPQVASVARKPLSIAFEEIAEGLIIPNFDPEPEPGSELLEVEEGAATEPVEGDGGG